MPSTQTNCDARNCYQLAPGVINDSVVSPLVFHLAIVARKNKSAWISVSARTLRLAAKLQVAKEREVIKAIIAKRYREMEEWLSDVGLLNENSSGYCHICGPRCNINLSIDREEDLVAVQSAIWNRDDFLVALPDAKLPTNLLGAHGVTVITPRELFLRFKERHYECVKEAVQRHREAIRVGEKLYRELLKETGIEFLVSPAK